MKIYRTMVVLVWFGICHSTGAASIEEQSGRAPKGPLGETGLSGVADQRETHAADLSGLSLTSDDARQDPIRAAGSTGNLALQDPQKDTFQTGSKGQIVQKAGDEQLFESLDVDVQEASAKPQSQDVTPTLAYTVPGNGKAVYGVALLRDELFVTRSAEPFVSVYDAYSLKIKRRIYITGYTDWLEGLAVCPLNNYLYVSDSTSSSQFIHRIALSSNYNVTTWRLPELNPRLSVNSAGNLLVTYQHSVQEYTPSGVYLRKLQDPGLVRAIEADKGTILVSRTVPIHGVELLMWDGEILNSIGNLAGSGAGAFNTPTNLVLESDGYIIVVDSRNNRLQVLNPSLTEARTLRMPPSVTFSSPSGISYDKLRGRLFVGELGSPFRLFAFDDVTNFASMFA